MEGNDTSQVASVDGLTYTYAAATNPAVRNLSFSIARGEIFGLLGPSGAGKSTTQKVLIGLLPDYGGGVSVFGKDLARWNADYYEQIGVSFELPNHYLKLSGLENLRYFQSLYRDRTRPPNTLLELVGLQDDGDRLVSQYSKGMKTRLGVARALLLGGHLKTGHHARGERDGVSFTAGPPWTASLCVVWCASCAAHT